MATLLLFRHAKSAWDSPGLTDFDRPLAPRGQRAAPRVAFAALLEAGLIAPGTELTDARRRWRARVQADGSVAAAGEQASIHKIGAKVQGLDACNGWTFWHFERDGALTPIDALRQRVRDRMAAAGG